jgi:hypothetical protein
MLVDTNQVRELGILKLRRRLSYMRDIKGYEGLYAVTSCGKVWSYRSKKFLKPYDNGFGYLYVNLNNDGKKKQFKIHRLVA